MNKLFSRLCMAFVALATSVTVGAQDLAGDAKAGEKKNAMCVGCHGIKGYHTGFPEVYKVPKIAGQGAPYIVNALRAYKSGERKHPSMRGIAANLTEQDMADLAAYYSAAAGTPAEPPVPTAVDAKAQELLAKGGCAACHGENFSKPLDPSYPKLAGQYPDYLFHALKAYKTEGGKLVGRNHPIMSAMAKQFSHAEMKVLADYVASLPGQIQTIQPERVR
ncbi:MAG: c-type cytochrome [Rhodoferax sp.]